MSVRLLTGDCRGVLATLPDASVQCCVTSPPYFGLRDYGTASWQGGDVGCDHKGRHKRTQAGFNERYFGRAFQGDKQGQLNENFREACGKCGATRIDQQIGLESTVEAYVAELVAVFRAVKRVLRDDGVLFLNLGDSYNAYNGNAKQGGPVGLTQSAQRPKLETGYGLGEKTLKPKDLIGIPWRVAFALQADGWYLRSDIIWAKPNPMPESVRDRPTKAHEYIFLLTKRPRYFFDSDAVREPHATPLHAPGNKDKLFDKEGTNSWESDRMDVAWGNPAGRNIRSVWTIAEDLFGDAVPDPEEPAPNPRKEPTRGQGYGAAKGALGRMPDRDGGFGTPDSGRNVRSVWTIATAPYAESHFATFPPALAERCIKAGTSEKGACSACGAPWVRVLARTPSESLQGGNGWQAGRVGASHHGPSRPGSFVGAAAETTGWQPTCTCDAPLAPCVVLDCFGGAGTVSLVSERLGRDSIYVDLSPEYAAMARARIYGDAPMFAVIETTP